MIKIFDVIVFGGIAWLAAPILGGLLWWMKFRKSAIFTGGTLFLIPLFVLLLFFQQQKDDFEKYKEDVAYTQTMCAKYGGDKIFRTVENVEGIFRVKERHPNFVAQLSDQFGMADPYGSAQGDPTHVEEFLNDQSFNSEPGYIYVEAPTTYGSSGPPYKRFYLQPTGKKIGDKYPGARNRLNPELEVVQKKVAQLASRYGYEIEDLSTQELRKRWIGGGRIKIIDLKTNEILAERVGYFRAPGLSVALHWGSAGLSGTDHFCPQGSSLKQFLHSVLKPVQAQITPAYSDF